MSAGRVGDSDFSILFEEVENATGDFDVMISKLLTALRRAISDNICYIVEHECMPQQLYLQSTLVLIRLGRSWTAQRAARPAGRPCQS
jgi:hypothetical protein